MIPMHIGIPAFCERAWLPSCLESLAAQSDLAFQVWVCVNQPAEWGDDSKYGTVTEENRATLRWLEENKAQFPFPLHVLPAIDPPLAPPARFAGVGWARRFLFDAVLAENADALCISLDADTTLSTHYVAQIRQAFGRYPNAVALAAPYYHQLPEDPLAARRLLRYEIYLRYYQLNLWRIGSPYSFMALGSAMAFRGKAYRCMGGMPRHKAGEDFYFLQQMRKTGPVISWIESCVFPSNRVSERNPFGTGPALAQTDESLLARRYPLYALSSFDLIHATFSAFEKLYEQAGPLPIDDYVQARWGGYHAFDKIRGNVKDQRQFVKACHERFDGLRTLQCLRHYQSYSPRCDEEAITALLRRLGQPVPELEPLEGMSIHDLNRLRDLLRRLEADFQRAHMEKWDAKARW